MKNTIYRKTLIAATVCTSLLSTTAVLADVVKISDDATLLQQENARYFSQSGLSGEEAKVIRTGGADLPLSLATSLLIPDNWKVKTSGNFKEAIVAWKGGVSWPIILRNISEKEQIYITLDWTKKIASIHVPGTNNSLSAYNQTDQSKKTLSAARENFKKAEQDEWAKKARYDSQTENQKTQFQSILDKQRDAQRSNQDLIAALSDSRQDALEQKLELEKALADERKKNELLSERFAVIDPTLSGKEQIDPTLMFKEHQEAWVLPYNDSPDYYLKGGHSDKIEYHTNATYIVKEEDVSYVLQKWADKIGWYVEYSASISHKSPYEFPIKGTFKEAATALILKYTRSKRPLNIDFLPDLKKTVKDPQTGEIKKYHGVVVVSDLNFSQGR